MITITCTEAERDLIIYRMGLNDWDTGIQLSDNYKVPIHWIIGTEAQTEKVEQVLNKCYPWEEV